MAKTKKDQSHDDWTDVMKTTQGRRVMNEILEVSGYMRPAFTGQSNQTIHNCGMQKVGEYIYSQTRTACPAMYIKMITEQLDGR
jgi:hypothetical protein